MPPKRSMSISGHSLQMHCFNVSKPRQNIFRNTSRRLQRYHNHTKSFRKKRYTKDNSLSKYISYLKWSIVKSVRAYSNITKKCLLCLHKKLEIVNYPHPEELLNKRCELVSKCRHANNYLLNNYKAND